MEGHKKASKQKGGEAHLRASKRLQRERERSGSRARNEENPCARRRVAREGEEAEEEEEKKTKAGRKTTTRKKQKKKKTLLPFAFMVNNK
jgi:hypothetical protein